MGFVATTIAFLLNTAGWTFYSHTKYQGIDDQEPAEPPSSSATVLFTLGVCVLLIQAELYPCYLKRLPKCAEFFYEVIVRMLLLEIAQIGFWYPLDAALKTLFLRDYCEESCLWCSSVLITSLTNLLGAVFLYSTLWATDSFNSICKLWCREKHEECPCTCHGSSSQSACEVEELQNVCK